MLLGCNGNVLRREAQIYPLFAVGSSEKSIIASQLLAAGVDPDALGDKGWSVLEFTGQSGFLEIAQMLLDAVASINELKREGEISSLLGVVSGEILKMVKALLGLGADVNQGNSAGWRPLYFAAGGISILSLPLITARSTLEFSGILTM